jgi:hypothetical protein
MKTTLAILLALCLGMSAVGDERPECEIMQLEKKNFEKTKAKAGKGDAERTSSSSARMPGCTASARPGRSREATRGNSKPSTSLTNEK